MSAEDTVSTVLSFVLADALLRFRAVCPSWLRLISDPAFCRVHAAHPAPLHGFFAPATLPGVQHTSA
jgi:hypothetical protein